MSPIMTLVFVSACVCLFVLGVAWERYSWQQLIDSGKIRVNKKPVIVLENVEYKHI